MNKYLTHAAYAKRYMTELIAEPERLYYFVKNILGYEPLQFDFDANGISKHNTRILELFESEYFPRHKVIIHSNNGLIKSYIMPLQWYRNNTDKIKNGTLLNDPQVKCHIHYGENTIGVISSIIRFIYEK